MEIPADLLDDDPGLGPEGQIYVDLKCSWFPISDSLPQLTKSEIQMLRRKLPDG